MGHVGPEMLSSVQREAASVCVHDTVKPDHDSVSCLPTHTFHPSQELENPKTTTITNTTYSLANIQIRTSRGVGQLS